MKTIPKQRVGAKSNTRFAVKLPSVKEARKLFETAKNNLLNVNDWHTIAGPHSALFEVVDEEGRKLNNEVKKGNYLRISIPVVPGSPEGEGADWVRVEKVNEQKGETYQCVVIAVRPAAAPVNDEPTIAHFFTSDATSTFSVERNNRTVVAEVHGRNEKPNVRTTSFWSWLRNLFVALAAMVGLNKPQWQSLVKGLIKVDNVGKMNRRDAFRDQ